MRNSKKVLALILAIAMMATSMMTAFAATPATYTYAEQATTLNDLGLYLGTGTPGGDFVPSLDQSVDRQTGTALIVRMLGGKDAAAALSAAEVTTLLANYTDKASAETYFLPEIAYAVKMGWVVGTTTTTLSSKDAMTGGQVATILVKAMGYAPKTTDEAITSLSEISDLTSAEATQFANKALIRDDLVGLLYGSLTAETEAGSTLIADLIAGNPELEQVAIDAGLYTAEVVTPATLAVNSVTALNAKAFSVKFNGAVEDIAKATFVAKRSTTVIALTPSWSVDKKEVALASATNLPEGSYTIAVTYDAKDLGTSTVAITQQKIAKIEITSSKLSVVNTGKGYATYKVIDQYGNDITTSYLASNVKFQSGVGSIDHKNGVITITPATGTNIIQFANVVITGYDTTSGVSVSATLTTSTALGSLSDFQLGAITNAENKVLTAGDVTSVFYISYTALDMSGNETKNYDLVAGGLILSSGTMSVSNPNVTATVVKDPSDATKAAIELKVTSTASVIMDMPLIITSMTYTGKTSTISTTLKKSGIVDTFTLMTPAFNVAVGDVGKEIPFEAYDQNGVKITDFDELDPNVSLNGGITLVENVNGSAKVVITPVGSDGPQIISAIVTNSGKMSNLTLNIQKQAVAESLLLDSTKLITAMQDDAVQKIDFGHDKGGLKVLDQFGREMDMKNGVGLGITNKYAVSVTSSTYAITLGGSTVLTKGNTQKTLTADGTNNGVNVPAVGGSSTLTFTLFNDTGVAAGHNGNNIQDADEKTIDTKSVTLAVVKNADITNYSIDPIASAIYANPNLVNGGLSPRNKDYAAQAKIYGKTSSGAKVVLASTPIIGAYVDNANEFEVTSGPGVMAPKTGYLAFIPSAVAYDGVKVTAGRLIDPTKTEATTNLTVTFNGVDGSIKSLTTAIKSSTAAPVASDLTVGIDKFKSGLSQDGDVVTIDSTVSRAGNIALALGDAGFITGNTMGKFLLNGAVPQVIDPAAIPATLPAAPTLNIGTITTTKAFITFGAKDQYGKTAMQLAQFAIVANATTLAGGANTITIDNQGILNVNAAGIATNNFVTISAVTNNGLVKTVKIMFK